MLSTIDAAVGASAARTEDSGSWYLAVQTSLIAAGEAVRRSTRAHTAS